MSYDISLMINTGIEFREVVDCGNYTYNIAPMYNLAFGKYWGDVVRDKKCADVVDKIEAAFTDMKANPDKYKEFNPKNGWGDYDSGLEYLGNLLERCKENPECVISIH